MAKERSFRRYDYDEMKKMANAKGGSFDSFVKSQYKVYKVKDGKNTIRILPAPEKASHFGLQLWVNYGIGPDKQSYLSIKKMLNKPDPLDEAMREADREDDEDTVKALRPKERYLYWLIDRDAPDEGPQLWAAPFTFNKDLVNLIIDEDTKEVIPLDDPQEGCDLRFYREKQGDFKVYPASKMKVMQPTVLSDDAKELKEWCKFVDDNPLEETLQYYDYNHISQVFNGVSKPKADEEERPARVARPMRDEETEDPPFDVDEPRGNGRVRTRPRDEEAEVEDDPPPRRTRPRLEPEDEEAPPPRRAAAKPRGEDEEGGSVRERLRRLRHTETADEAD